jgi:ferredoxin
MNTRHPQNVPGRFYVTLDCLSCEACQAVAPNHFCYGEYGMSYVFKQPTTPEELKQCQEATANCPLEAIKDDGA